MSRSIEPYILTKRSMSGLIDPDILPLPIPCYSSVRIEFQKEDKLTHMRYGVSKKNATITSGSSSVNFYLILIWISFM